MTGARSSLTLAGALAALLTSTACGSQTTTGDSGFDVGASNDEIAVVDEPTDTGAEPASSDDPGPSEVEPDIAVVQGQDLLKQELAILGGSRHDVVDAIAAFDGVLTEEIEATNTYQAAFPVATLDELLAIRRELEANGFDVALVATIENP